MRRTLLLLILAISGCADAVDAPAGRTASPSPAEEALLTLAAEDDAPVATLSFGDDQQRAALGTRCWALGCVDFVGPPPPRGFTAIPRGTVLRVESDAARISATLGEPAEEEFGALVGAREIDLTDGEETLDLEPGRYVLELFVMWRAQGDAVMTLGIEIT